MKRKTKEKGKVEKIKKNKGRQEKKKEKEIGNIVSGRKERIKKREKGTE